MSDHRQSQPNADSEVPSKTARKREAERLQGVGRRLGALNAEQLAGLSLPPQLYTAITDYQRFASHGAKRRQLQFIGKLMRKIDTEAIEAQLQDLDGESAQARYAFNQMEQWRDTLLANPDALTEFIEAYPQVDRQQLRQLLKKLRGIQDSTQQKQQARVLFRFIRETVEAHT